LAQTIGQLAALDLKMHNFVEANELEHQVLDIDEKKLGPDHPETAIALMNLGYLYESMGMLSKSESFYEQALAIRQRALGHENPSISASLNNLASLYLKMDNAGKAAATFQQALDIDQKVLGSDHPTTEIHMGNLAITYLDLQKTNEALHYADLAEEAQLKILDNILSFASEKQRLGFESQSSPYSVFAALNDAHRLALAIFRHKGVVLDSLLEDRLVAEASQNAEDRALIEQLGPAKKQLTELIMQAPKDTDAESLKTRAARRAELSRQVEQLEGALAKKVAGLGHARRALTVTLEQVQKTIPQHTILVEFIQFGFIRKVCT
jgi:tetratricopeptide (TPR) repeat protein